MPDALVVVRPTGVYLLDIYVFLCFWRRCIDNIGVFLANQTSMCLDPHLNYEVGAVKPV